MTPSILTERATQMAFATLHAAAKRSDDLDRDATFSPVSIALIGRVVRDIVAALEQAEQERDALRRRSDVLAEALDDYGHHLPGCRVSADTACTCGLDMARSPILATTAEPGRGHA